MMGILASFSSNFFCNIKLNLKQKILNILGQPRVYCKCSSPVKPVLRKKNKIQYSMGIEHLTKEKFKSLNFLG